MVNFVELQKPLMKGLMKLAGVAPRTVVIDKGTAMNMWVPTETLPKSHDHNDEHDVIRPSASKPVVVLVHGFAAEGIVTWQFQVGALAKKYSVYVPDLIFFGGSATESGDRSPAFQAACLAKGLRAVGIERCAVVGFSYGGMVAFKMAEMFPEMVRGMVISGSILAMTDNISAATLESLGVGSSSELLLPGSVKGLKALLKLSTYKKLWFPDRLYNDFLQVMFNNRKERGELLEGLVVSNKDATIPHFSQKIHLLWGENDQIFRVELAQDMKEQLGDLATFEGIPKAGHLVHLERPCFYNRCLKKFLASLDADQPQN